MTSIDFSNDAGCPRRVDESGLPVSAAIGKGRAYGINLRSIEGLGGQVCMNFFCKRAEGESHFIPPSQSLNLTHAARLKVVDFLASEVTTMAAVVGSDLTGVSL